ncbi:MAG: pantoate--beta-alanine ligase [Nitrospinota bacterium]|nr:pantoate--beta-alanine ligase [Nitrospinota bacterium]MDH5679166.1 pantoate--beta-alanine ligase [Nitrospinota bacterium]
MKTIRKPGAMNRETGALRAAGRSLGLVPTLGCLHLGHLALIKKARRENDMVAVSIFVNPLQFKPKAYQAYPRDLEQDRRELEKAGVDFLFAPRAEDMYPEGFDTRVEVLDLVDKLEGKSIRWHYRGVTTVVAKLFNIVDPHRAYFGRKDPHQLALIRRMVADLNFPVKIIAVPTIREPDGLAHSSRNTLLTPEERVAASAIPRALGAIETMIRQGATDRQELTMELVTTLAMEPLIKVDFAAVVDAETLEQDVFGKSVLIHAAVIIGGKRLTDNRVVTS